MTNRPEITIIGCGTPTPTPDRFGSSYVIEIGGEKLLFDCGPATTHKLVKAGIFPTEIDTRLLHAPSLRPRRRLPDVHPDEMGPECAGRPRPERLRPAANDEIH